MPKGKKNTKAAEQKEEVKKEVEESDDTSSSEAETKVVTKKGKKEASKAKEQPKKEVPKKGKEEPKKKEPSKEEPKKKEPKKEEPESSSDSEDDSDDSSEEEPKKKELPKKEQPKKTEEPKKAEKSKKKDESEESSDEEEDSDDDEDDEDEKETTPMQVDQSKTRPAAQTPTPSKSQKTEAAQTPSTPQSDETTTVFLRNVNYDTVEDSIYAAMEQYGPIKEVRINMDKVAQRSRGSAFVEFETAAAAKAAIEFSGNEIDGKAISVEFANSRKPSTPGSERRSSFQSAPAGAPSKVIYVGNLSYDTTSESLREAFTDLEGVTDVRVVYGPDGQSRGFGYIDFEDVDNATKMLDSNGKNVDGRNIRLDYAPEKGQGGGRGGFGGNRGGGGGRGFGNRGDRGGGRGFGNRGDRGGRGFGNRGDRGGRGRASFSGKKTTFN